MRIALLAVGLLASLSLTGCQGTVYSQQGGIPRSKVYRNVVSISPSATELVVGLGAKITGRTASDDYPPTIKDVTVVMKGVKPNYEEISAMQTQLVVYDSELFSESDIAKFRELNIDTFDVNSNSIAELEDKVQKLGALLGLETMASAYVDRIRKAIDSVSGAAPEPKRKIAIILPGNGSEHLIAGNKSFLAELYDKLGGQLVGPDANNFVPLNAESFRALNPDLIIVGGKADSIRKDPRFAGMKAITGDHIFEFINQGLLIRRGVRVDKLAESLFNIMVTKGGSGQ
jgi:ABC-type Fe3+-hydroxamate transport system substrate-binding protein